ncbi:MAG: tRNA uridine-5-carboxymethylaminomethyl(34) synthesis GTPase MnmE [Lachnospiraceae bacterium]|nr:tRNA uridine-5-carboxymethylaminomethyl(34) synthesis GTPase MnmE [Lachnospiraceae bacterium]
MTNDLKSSRETIAAISTGLSTAGIGIVRISGPDAVNIADKLYRNKQGEHALPAFQAGSIHFGYVVDEHGQTVDEVMVSVYRAPHSFTAEDTVEINAHGGVFLLQKILSLSLQAGARLAEPGEFTKRAFLNGRIDLTRAEAVMDMISARNESARKIAAAQLSGEVSERIRDIRGRILTEIAFIESALDDPENFSLEEYPEELTEKVTGFLAETDALLKNAEEGKIRKEGVTTAILGKPNAGKSSLLNRLIGEERSIVTQIPGTTRDTIDESLRVGEGILHLIDTAGIHETEDTVEKIGIDRSRQAAENAQLLLLVLDAATGITQEDEEILQYIQPLLEDGKKCLLLFNKSDVNRIEDPGAVLASKAEVLKDLPCLSCSMATGEGLSEIREWISKTFRMGEALQEEEIYLTNLRHIEELQEVRSSLLLVQQALADNVSEDLYVVDLMNAYTALSRILGEQVEDDLIEEIFSKFCLGK